MEESAKWERRITRERAARKEAEKLLEEKSLELWKFNQELEQKIIERTHTLEEALASAKEANRAKDAFLSNMSHEIRTPLNAIIGFVDILLRQAGTEAKTLKYLGIIKQSGKNLQQIINDILDYSKIQSGKFSITAEPSHLKERLLAACELFRASALEKEITYTINFDSSIPICLHCDATRVAQIVSNFISNAIKFTSKYGTVKVDAAYLFEESSLILHVRDTGIGIDPEQQHKIFSPFEQADKSITKSHGGTGLGLSTSLSLIEIMHGKLIFESIKHEGSTFGFIIPMPLCPQTLEQTRNEQLPIKVLLCSSDKKHRTLLGAMLESLGVDYDLATSCEEAQMTMPSNAFDLIISAAPLEDLNLPSLRITPASEPQGDHTLPFPLGIDALEQLLKHYLRNEETVYM